MNISSRNTISREDVRIFLKEYLAEKLSAQGKNFPRELPDDCDLLLSGMIDSVGLLDLMSAIQRHWEREIDFEALDPEEMTIVGPLCRYVSEQIAEQLMMRVSFRETKASPQNLA